MYEPPIKVFLSAMHTEQEGEILKAVQRIGVAVDKERLIDALAYDSQQYSKGYEDGWRAAQEWISVEDRAPEDDCDVILCTRSKSIAFGHYNNFFEDWVQYDSSGSDLADVTHWMPLPKTPKEE